MDFRVTIATGEFPHQPNNTINCPRKIRYCGVIWLVSNYTVVTERIHVAGGDAEAQGFPLDVFLTEVIVRLQLPTLMLTERLGRGQTILTWREDSLSPPLDLCREIQSNALEDQKCCYTSNAISSYLDDGRFELRQGNEKIWPKFLLFSKLLLGKCWNSSSIRPWPFPSPSACSVLPSELPNPIFRHTIWSNPSPSTVLPFDDTHLQTPSYHITPPIPIFHPTLPIPIRRPVILRYPSPSTVLPSDTTHPHPPSYHFTPPISRLRPTIWHHPSPSSALPPDATHPHPPPYHQTLPIPILRPTIRGYPSTDSELQT
jgi:hypothetical protein